MHSVTIFKTFDSSTKSFTFWNIEIQKFHPYQEEKTIIDCKLSRWHIIQRKRLGTTLNITEGDTRLRAFALAKLLILN